MVIIILVQAGELAPAQADELAPAQARLHARLNE